MRSRIGDVKKPMAEGERAGSPMRKPEKHESAVESSGSHSNARGQDRIWKSRHRGKNRGNRKGPIIFLFLLGKKFKVAWV